MELKAAFKAGNAKLVEYGYDVATGEHTVAAHYGCLSGAVIRKSTCKGRAISWLAPFRTTFDEADPAQMLIRYLSK